MNNINKKIHINLSVNESRRRFIKHSSLLMATSPLAGLSPAVASAAGQIVNVSAGKSSLAKNSLGFNGERQDSATGLYHLGKGYRVYNPALMRFHASDSMSPFGKGGINSYAYCLGDPINLKDPSGHFALMSLLIGAIVGAVVGASISAAAEGIRAAATDTKFDWKQVGIGAALGFISGGFGAAAVGAKTGAQVGLAVADAVVSGAADFGLNVATGIDTKQAGINAGIGAVIGLATFGLGKGISKGFTSTKTRFPTGMNSTITSANKGKPVGRNFLLYQGDPNQSSSRLVLTSHGMASPTAGFTADTKLNYYAPHGKALVDPGLSTATGGTLLPTEIIGQGHKSKTYLLSNFPEDTAQQMQYTAKRSQIDVMAIRPGRVTTNKQLLKSLQKAGLRYSEIDMIHCRCHTPFGGGFDALYK
ncbi:RHS repeat-associated core domain-containing protein [Shewanella sp. VB17]|uniref:RHS repeat-associated core domain-containing protein n=1 Tax=Shewanella sp. VB17 TaxID=2739432 RepID=UPI001565696E|nr:RHS repeat-associated core domain-containing protein [Shewanella sp. VB17]NRD73994.1 RHS repeat-associated core domain-containing protein [Shewanella sp. VB17]